MPANNFKLFDENKQNMLSDQEYQASQQRLGGVQAGIASSMLNNKFAYQMSLIAYAIAQMMNANGYDATDALAVSAFVGNLSNSVLQKVIDKATTAEAVAGTNDAKWITPAKVKQFAESHIFTADKVTISQEVADVLGLSGDPTVDDGLAGIAAELAKGAWVKLKTVAVNITGTTTAAAIAMLNAGDIDFNNVDEILIEIRDMVTNTVVTKAGTAAYVRLDGTDICSISPNATGTKTFAFPYVSLITKNSGQWYTDGEDTLSLSIAGEVKNVVVTSAYKNAKDIRLSCFCREGYASSIKVTGTANIYTRKWE